MIPYICYLAVKLAGYTYAARYLNRTFPEKARNIFLVGIIRTSLGFGFGLLAFSLNRYMPASIGKHPFLFSMFVLTVVRTFEWALLIRIFYWTAYAKSELSSAVPFLVVWSFLLDIPIFIGLLPIVGAFC